MEWLKNLNKTNRYLLLAAILLFLVAVGLYAYSSGSEERYLAKCRAGEQVLIDTKNLLGEIKDLKGAPDGEDVKEYLERLKNGQDNLGKLRSELRGMHVSSKYQESQKNLLAALEDEEAILKDAEAVLKHPLDEASREAVERVKEKASAITETVSGIRIPSVDFSEPLQLDAVGNELGGYISKKIALDAAKKAEEERLAREAEEKRLAEINQRLMQKNSELIASTSDVVWITTHVDSVGDNRLNLTGYFYNGTTYPIIQMNSMKLIVTLYKRGVQIYRDEFFFGNITWNGLIYPYGRLNHVLYVTNNNGTIPSDFDEFDVEMDSANWRYQTR